MRGGVETSVMDEALPCPAPSRRQTGVATLTVGLVNNMPDAALEQTERQFRDLLAGATTRAARFVLFTLPGVPRGDTTWSRLTDYMPFGSIGRAGLDLLVITGTEPRSANLRDEPYWQPFAELLDWAEAAGVPTVLSCLAAHAALLHSDGIERRRLAEKCFGVFEQEVVRPHPLTRGLPARFAGPHSRWHEIPEAALAAGGWQVLTRSAEVGPDLFVRERRGLTIGLQGHPEYDPDSLAREFRRDVRRYLLGDRSDYPRAPIGALAPETLPALEAFRARALAARGEALLPEFPPLAPLLHDGAAPWRAAAATIWRNVMAMVAEDRARHV